MKLPYFLFLFVSPVLQNDANSGVSLTDSNTSPTPKMVTLSPRETFNFDDDTWDDKEEEKEEERAIDTNPFVRSSPKKAAPPPPVPSRGPPKQVESAREPVKKHEPAQEFVATPVVSVRQTVVQEKPSESVKVQPTDIPESPPPMPKSKPPQPQTSTPTLDSVISSIGLGNSSPLVVPKSPQLSEKDYSLESGSSVRNSARITATPPSHRKLEVRIATYN